MEWMNRGERQGQPAGHATNTPGVSSAAQAGTKQKGGVKGLGGLKIVHVALLFSVTVLLVAVVWLLAIGGDKQEKSYVDENKLQAVFLNGGQVYFGKINNLNGKFLSMNNIYYLRVNQQVQPNQDSSASANDISLVKLGCELHGPQDNMVINREQVIFWENLKDDGQVAKAVADYQKQNPGEQKCDQTTGTDTSTGTETPTGTSTPTGTGTGTSTGTGTPNTNKPTTTR